MSNDSSQDRPDISFGKKLLFTALILLLVAPLLEFGAARYLRWFQGYDGEHLMQYRFDPYKNMHPMPDYRDVRGIDHNSVGFRESREFSVDKPENTYRIFLMGGSTAYGTGGLWTHIEDTYSVLDNSETIDAFLERILEDRFGDVDIQVINAAMPSIWTHHHLIYINQRILEYDPDMILFLDGFNDFFFFDRDHDQFSDYAYQQKAHTIMGPPTLRSLVTMNGWWLFRKSAFFHAVFRSGREAMRALQAEPEQTPVDVDRAVENAQYVFDHNALEMIERTALILRREGVEAVFMLQPMLILEENGKPLTAVERELYEFNVESYRPNYGEYMRRVTPRLAAMERDTVQSLGGTFIDLTGIYSDVELQVYTDYCHLTPLGNELLAEVVADSISPIIRGEIASSVAGSGPSDGTLASPPRTSSHASR